MGRMARARTRLRPGNVTRASTHASGSPSTTDSPVAHSEQTNESRSASSATGEVRSVPSVDHETLVNRPIRGSAKKATVTVATATTATAGRRLRSVMVPATRAQWAGRKLAWRRTLWPVVPRT